MNRLFSCLHHKSNLRKPLLEEYSTDPIEILPNDPNMEDIMKLKQFEKFQILLVDFDLGGGRKFWTLKRLNFIEEDDILLMAHPKRRALMKTFIHRLELFVTKTLVDYSRFKVDRYWGPK